MISDDDMEGARARSALAVEQGVAWVKRMQPELDALPTGMVVVVNVLTGEWTAGKTWLEAHRAFAQRFGTSIPGYVHRVRDRTFIGGGIG